jgi:beta-galactosidase
MHAGLNLPGSHELSLGGREATEAGIEIKAVGPLPVTAQASVALVYDYEASWITRIQPQGADYHFEEITFRFYEAARRLGLDVDFVPPGASLAGYKLVLAPCLPHVSDQALKAFEGATGVVFYGPRTGSKTRHLSISDGLPPGPLRELTGVRITQVSSLRPNVSEPVKGVVSGKAVKWREYLEASSNIMAHFSNGDAAFTAKGNHHYLACWPDETLLAKAMTLVCKKAGLATTALPAHIRLRRRGHLTFAFNYGNESWAMPKGAKPVLGSKRIAPQSLGIWQD